VARKALKGILARGNHRLAVVATVAEAWDFIRRNVAVDLVFLELKLEGESGLALLENLRANAFLKLMPVVIYTGVADRAAVKKATEIKVQNFLVKPYVDQQILAEVGKVLANPWRNQHFEEEKSFCTMMGYTPDGLHKMLDQLRTSLTVATPVLRELAAIRKSFEISAKLNELSELAEAAGAWGVVEMLGGLRDIAERDNWELFTESLASLDYAERFIFSHLNPDIVPEDFVTAEERNEVELAKAREHWFNAPLEDRCPVVQWPQLAQEMEALSGFPVIDSVAASFQMSATGHPSSLAPLMDLAENDPGLSAHLLVAANKGRPTDDFHHEPIENPRLCISMLGEIKLAAMAAGIVSAPESMMDVPPCSWTKFWAFQVGVGRMAQYTCRYLEFNSLEPRAYAAGLLHDLGKLLLLHLQPIGFQAIVDYARRENVPLRAAEEKFLGCTTRDMAAHFAVKHGLLNSYANVMRWVDDPVQATDDAVLVAIVSLARDLCRRNRMGWSGEIDEGEMPPIADTAAWQILRERVFPSFNLEKFEAEAHAQCRELKLELHGQLASSRS
jgi:CheY-like chemotaxis protein/HD-like signal output (HDOD) protein